MLERPAAGFRPDVYFQVTIAVPPLGTLLPVFTHLGHLLSEGALTELLLNPDYCHKFFHRAGALMQCGGFLLRELDFDDLFEALRSQLAGHPDEQAFDPVLTLKIGG